MNLEVRHLYLGKTLDRQLKKIEHNVQILKEYLIY